MPAAAPYLKPSNRQHQNTLGDYQLEQIKGTVATGKKWLWSPNLPVLLGSQSPQPKASLSVLPSSLTICGFCFLTKYNKLEAALDEKTRKKTDI